MNISFRTAFKILTASFALISLSPGYCQIPDAELNSIFNRLNGDDFDARYAAKIELQNHVVEAIKPGNESDRSLVTAQLLQHLNSEPLLTSKLWILRQLSHIGSSETVASLKPLLDSENERLADAAGMTISTIMPSPSIESDLAGDSDALLKRVKDGDNRSARYQAFEALSAHDPKLAAQILEEELVKESSDSLADFLRLALQADQKSLETVAMAQLASDDVAKQIVVLGSLSSKVSTKIEKQLIALLDTDSQTLKIQTLEALGRVGSVHSLQAILELTEAKSRDLRTTASDKLAKINDKRIDKKLLKSIKSPDADERILALKALSYRATDGITELVNQMAADSSLEKALRKEAISTMVSVGNLASLPILVNVVTNEPGLRRDAQKALKRMTLRTDDPEAAWSAFAHGFESADEEAKTALIQVIDSAPSKGAIDFLLAEWAKGDPALRKLVLRILPQWRNWDGGFALLEIRAGSSGDEKLSTQCFKGISRLLLSSDANYPLPPKYELVAQAFAASSTPSDRQLILAGFKNCDWKDGVYIKQIEVDDELRQTIEGIVGF